MVAYTDEYGLSKPGPNEDWTAEGYKFSVRDRDTIARLLKIGAETHHHTGVSPVGQPTSRTLGLTVSQVAGNIPAGTTVRYKYTFVDVDGFETTPSAEYTVTTPDAIASPGAPQLTTQSTGGTILPGQYHYVLTAYTVTNTQETKAIAPNYITVPVATATNKVTLTLPTLPSGATGFNVYVKRPGQTRYNYLASILMTGATPPLTYVDNGSVAENCNRTIPAANSSHAHNTVNIQMSGGALPAGTTWKLYRTYSTDYSNSFLHHVVEETFEGSGIITTAYSDLGTATFAGGPPATSQAVGTPSKIDLQDGNEVRRQLPMGLLSGFPYVVTFSVPGTLTAPKVGSFCWPCEFPKAKVLGVRAVLGRGSAPASRDVIVDVNMIRPGATPIDTTLYTTQSTRPKVAVGQQRGIRVTPQITDLIQGDLLYADLDQDGGGATPTDKDLTISVYMIAYDYPATLSFNPASPGSGY